MAFMEHYEEQGKSVVFCSLTNLVDTNWYVDFKFTLRRQSRVVVEKHALRTGRSNSCGQEQRQMEATLSPNYIREAKECM